MSKAVIMDRDGTIVQDRHFLCDPKHIKVYKGVLPALHKLHKRGWKLIIGTNQSGIGRGLFTVDQMHAVHDGLLKIFKAHHVPISDIYFCPHHPDDVCRCRKPELGMLLEASKKHKLDLSKCVVVGDKASDMSWGKKGGTKTVLVLTGYGRKANAELKTRPDHVAGTFASAAEWILKHE